MIVPGIASAVAPAIASVMALAALLLGTTDPAGDAFGNGALLPPSAPVYQDATVFDLRELEVVGDGAITVEITMGSLSNPAGLPLGFTHPVIEVYLDSADGGARELLPGSGLQLPAGVGWEFALRITGDAAVGYAHRPDAAPVELPVGIRIDGSTIVATTPFDAVDGVEGYAAVGLYDPLGDAVWRPLTRERSTWSFSSAEQRRPVIDVLAPTVEAQAAAIDSGVLPRPSRATTGSLYLLLMAIGLVVALVGLLLRRRVTAGAATEPADDADALAEDGSASPAPPATNRDLDPPALPGSVPVATDALAGERRPFGWNGAAIPAPGERRERRRGKGSVDGSGARGAPASSPPESPSAPPPSPAATVAATASWLRDDDPFSDPFAREFGALFGDDAPRRSGAPAAPPARAEATDGEVAGDDATTGAEDGGPRGAVVSPRDGAATAERDVGEADRSHEVEETPQVRSASEPVDGRLELADDVFLDAPAPRGDAGAEERPDTPREGLPDAPEVDGAAREVERRSES